MSEKIQKPVFSIKNDGKCAVIIETPVEICTMDFIEDRIKFHKDYWISIDSVTSTMAQYNEIKKAYENKIKGEDNGKEANNEGSNKSSSKNNRKNESDN